MGTNLWKLLKSSLGMKWGYCLFSENQNGTAGEMARQLRPLAALPGDRVWFPGSKRLLTIMSNSSSRGSDTPFWPLCAHVMHRHGCRHVPGMSPFFALIVSWDSFCCIKAGFELMILLPLWPECWDIGIHHWCTALFSLIFNSVLILGGLCVRRCTSDVGKTGAFLWWNTFLKYRLFIIPWEVHAYILSIFTTLLLPCNSSPDLGEIFCLFSSLNIATFLFLL